MCLLLRLGTQWECLPPSIDNLDDLMVGTTYMAIQFPGGRPLVLPLSNQQAEHSSLDATPAVATSAVEAQHQAPRGTRSTAAMLHFRMLDLPLELQQEVTRIVQADPDRIQGVSSMDALMVTCHSLREVINKDVTTQLKYKMNKKIILAVRRLPLASLSTCPPSTLKLVAATKKIEALDQAFSDLDMKMLNNWANRLPALGKEQYKKFFDFLENNEHRLSDEHLSKFIGNMGSGFNVLSHEQHESLISMIANMDEYDQSVAIFGFGEGLHSLHEDLRQFLFHTTLHINDAQSLSIAICGMAKGFGALVPFQRTQLVKAALSIEDEELLAEDEELFAELLANVLAALGPHLGLLESAEQDSMIGAAVSLTNPDNRTRVIGALTHSLAKCDDNQKINIYAKLRSKISESSLTDRNKAEFIHMCGKELKSLEHSEGARVYQELVNDTFSILSGADRSYAIRGVADGLHFLSAYDKDRLVLDAVVPAENEEDKRDALTGLIKNQKYLTDEQQSAVFEAMLKTTNENKAIIIADLGASIGLLTPSQRQELVAATLAMDNELDKMYAMSGLGKAIKSLTDSQIGGLVDAALGMKDKGNKTEAIKALAGIQGRHRDRLIDGIETLSTDSQIEVLNALAEHLS